MEPYRPNPRSEQERRNRRGRGEEHWGRRSDYEREPSDPFEGQPAQEEWEFVDPERERRRFSQERYPSRGQSRYDRGFENLEDWEKPRQFGQERSQFGQERYRSEERTADRPYGSAQQPEQRSWRPQRYDTERYGTERFGTQQPFGSGRYGGEFERQEDRFGRDRGWGTHTGKGPKGYQRSDERIQEEISDCMTADPEIDASEISISVSQGEVTLEGTVSERSMKRAAEDLAEEIAGVREVNNRLRVERKEGKEDKGDAERFKASQSTSASFRGTEKR